MRRLLAQYGNTRSRGVGLSSQFRIDRSLPPHLACYIRSRCKVLRIRRMEEVVAVRVQVDRLCIRTELSIIGQVGLKMMERTIWPLVGDGTLHK